MKLKYSQLDNHLLTGDEALQLIEYVDLCIDFTDE